MRLWPSSQISWTRRSWKSKRLELNLVVLLGKTRWKLEVFMGKTSMDTLENHIETTFQWENHQTIDDLSRYVWWHQRVPLKRAVPQAHWPWVNYFFRATTFVSGQVRMPLLLDWCQFKELDFMGKHFLPIQNLAALDFHNNFPTGCSGCHDGNCGRERTDERGLRVQLGNFCSWVPSISGELMTCISSGR